MNGQTFFIYARKSTKSKDRQIRSIADQLAELRELATRENLNIADIFIEKLSAKAPGRPVFNDMLARIEAGEATGILAWAPDRLARNSLDGGRIIYLVDTGKITALKFVTFVFDPSPSGKFMLSIMFGQSKHYVDALSEIITHRKHQKVKDGIWPQWAPIGYINDKTTRTIIPHPEYGQLVRRMFELYATGNYTLQQVRDTVVEAGLTGPLGKPPAVSKVHYALSNPIYTGLIRYKNEIYQGKHQPLVTKELFDRVQEAMRAKSKPKTPTLKPYLYRGFLRCGECGCFITTETQKGHNYLRCTKRVKRDCSQKYLREDNFREQLSRHIGRVSVPTEWADWMLTELEKEKASDTSAASVLDEALRRHIKSVDEQLDRLMDAYLEQTVSLDEYRPAKSRLIQKKKQKEEELAEAERHRSGWFEPAIRFVQDVKYGGILASSDDDEEKLTFAKKTGSNFRLVNRELICDPRDAWQLVVDTGSFAHHTTAPSCDDAVVAGENHPHQQQRRGGDSNSRYPCGQTGFRNRRIQPLCHLSGWSPSPYSIHFTWSKPTASPIGDLTRYDALSHAHLPAFGVPLDFPHLIPGPTPRTSEPYHRR
jgi:site-specific DNA recombinase